MKKEDLNQSMARIHGYHPDKGRPCWMPPRKYHPKTDPSLGLTGGYYRIQGDSKLQNGRE